MIQESQKVNHFVSSPLKFLGISLGNFTLQVPASPGTLEGLISGGVCQSPEIGGTVAVVLIVLLDCIALLASNNALYTFSIN